MHTGRILVVAPDDDLRHSLGFALAAYGYTVRAESAWPPMTGLDDIDCILLDEHALKRAAGVLPALPVDRPVLLLAYSEQGLANVAVTGVIAMPLQGDAVIRAVAAALVPMRRSAK